jgi:hypothetical protein
LIFGFTDFHQEYCSTLEKSGVGGGDDGASVGLQEEVEQLRSALERTLLEQEAMRKVMGRMVGQEEEGRVMRKSSKSKASEGSSSSSVHEAFVKEAEDGYYFESYDDCGIHGDMLNVRLLPY